MKKKSETKSPAQIVPDFHLWQQVGHSIDPKRIARPAPVSKLTSTRKLPSSPCRALPPKKVQTTEKREKGLSGIHRRRQQRLMRGQLEPQARIDLHGNTVAQALVLLRSFLARCQHQGLKHVLVITGKGFTGTARHVLHGRQVYDLGPGSGKIRQSFVRWIEEGELGPLVTGVQPAHPRHGGGGAFYVQLRTLNKSPR